MCGSARSVGPGRRPSGGGVRWDVDARRASLYTRAYERAMWLARDKHAFEGAENTLSVARDRQQRGDRPPTAPTRLLARTTVATVAGMKVWTVRPRRATPVARVFYVHGGGYVHPLTGDYWRLVRALARVPAEVVVPAYPLAPAATVDDVLPRLVESAVRTDSPRPRDLPTVLMGDSAGGALVLAMSLRLRDTGGSQPVGIVALSPWLDAELAEDAVQDLEATDPMLAETGLRAAGRWWAGTRPPDHPLVSPVHASLKGLPPIDVFIGAHDILRPGVEAFASRARHEGTALHVHEHPEMFHVWMTRLIPEGRRARRDLVGLVRERVGRQGCTR